MFAFIAIAEVLVRLSTGAGTLATDYWNVSAGQKYEWYKHIVEVDPPDGLIIGDSTGARNFAPVEIEWSWPGVNVFNLATPGNFPIALNATTLPLLDRADGPDWILLSAFSGSFFDSRNLTRIESSILDSRVVRHSRGEYRIEDFVALTRAYRNRYIIRDALLGRENSLKAPALKGFMPDHRDAQVIARREAARDSGDAISVFELVPERLATVTSLASLAKRRGIKLVVVLPIQLDLESHRLTAMLRNWLQIEAARLNFAVLDLSVVLNLEDGDFLDVLHLTASGARKQSRAVGDILESCHFADDWVACVSQL